LLDLFHLQLKHNVAFDSNQEFLCNSGFKVRTAVLLKILFLWDVTLSLGEEFLMFRGIAVPSTSRSCSARKPPDLWEDEGSRIPEYVTSHSQSDSITSQKT
jgi:hypothetical protein